MLVGMFTSYSARRVEYIYMFFEISVEFSTYRYDDHKYMVISLIGTKSNAGQATFMYAWFAVE